MCSDEPANAGRRVWGSHTWLGRLSTAICALAVMLALTGSLAAAPLPEAAVPQQAAATFTDSVAESADMETAAEIVIAGATAGATDADPVSSPPIWPLAIGAVAAILLFVALRGWALPRELDRSSPDVALGVTTLAALAVAMLLMAPIGATIAVAVTGANTGTSTDSNTLRGHGIAMIGAYLAQGAVMIAWLLMRSAARPPGVTGAPSRVAVPPRCAGPVRAIGIGILAFAISWPIVAAAVTLAGAIRLGITGETTEQLAHDTLKALHVGTGSWRIVVMLLAALAAPLFEEIVFRGLMQPALRALGAAPWTAIILVSTLFSAVHFGAVPPPAIAGLFVLGLAFGWARERSGGVIAPIVAHGLFNIGNLALASTL